MTRFNNYDLPGKPPVLKWNPLAMRCTNRACPEWREPGTQGHLHCWHLRMARYLAAQTAFPDAKRCAWAGEGEPVLDERILAEPSKRRKPAVIAVQFMGDLGDKSIPADMLLCILDEVCGDKGKHTWLLLTKQPALLFSALLSCFVSTGRVYAGMSAWDQDSADDAMKDLTAMATAGWRVWLSLEPLLGPIVIPPADMHRLSMVAAGPETGPGARPCDPAWLDSIAQQCCGSVPFYDKRDGGNRAVPW